MLVIGVCLSAFGLLEFIPHDQQVTFVLAGFLLRIAQAIGVAGSRTSCTSIAVERFPDSKNYVLVSTWVMFLP